MKKSLVVLALLAAGSSAFAAAPYSLRTANNGVEYYSTTEAGKASAESDCVIPSQYGGQVTMGVGSQRRIDSGDQTIFVDCKPRPVVVAPAVIVRTQVREEVKVVPAAQPQREVTRTPKRVRE